MEKERVWEGSRTLGEGLPRGSFLGFLALFRLGGHDSRAFDHPYQILGHHRYLEELFHSLYSADRHLAYPAPEFETPEIRFDQLPLLLPSLVMRLLGRGQCLRPPPVP